MKHVILLVLLILIVFSGISQQKPLVLQASANGRYLQWSDGKPFFINACTAWTLCHDYSDQEVKDYLDNRVAGKFNTIQMSAVFGELVKTMADSAFLNHDLLRPVPKYWQRVDWVVNQATERGLMVMINPIWKSSLNEMIRNSGSEKCLAFGKWFANRYKNNPRVIYFLGGNQAPEPVRSEIEAMGKGIQTIYLGKAIVAYHGEVDQSSLEAYPNAEWISLNMTHAYSPTSGKGYPYSENYDNWRAFPKVPIQLGEGYYDFGDTKNYDKNGITDRWGNRLVVRRQAWWNFLSGGMGNAWGAEGIWNKNADGQNWKTCTAYASSKDMGFMKQFIDKTKWLKLEPDIDHQLLTGGYGTFMTDDYAVCAVSKDRLLAVVYSPLKQSLELALNNFGQYSRARWFDPTDGRYITIDMRFLKKKKKSVILTTPEVNNSGGDDWVLIIEQSRSK